LLRSGAIALRAALVFYIAHYWNGSAKFSKFVVAEVRLPGAVLRDGIAKQSNK
jgi:hypothetical protein